MGRHIATRAAELWASLPLVWRIAGIALLGIVAATGVGLATSQTMAAPNHFAVPVRVAIIATLIAAGIYALTSENQARMGGLLIGVGFFAALWLLNGSSEPLLFSIGVLCIGVMPGLLAYLMLAHPTGHLSSQTARALLWWAGGGMAILWMLVLVIAPQPPLKTPFLQCAPHCPANVFYAGSVHGVLTALKVAITIFWIAVALGAPYLLYRRWQSAAAPMRRALAPVLVMGIANGVLLVTYRIALAAGLGIATASGALYVAVGVVIPVAFIVGLGNERIYMADALAKLLNQFGRLSTADPESLIASALRDRSLRIAYPRPGREGYVNSAGEPVTVPPDRQAITWINRAEHPVAAVMYDPELEGQERYVRAAGSAALMALEKAQLEADLKASNAELAESRVRLMETAHAERRRLERDLHDGVQQQLVGARIKLELAAEALDRDPSQGRQALASVGEQLDITLEALRSLAHGIYPAVLREYGLVKALQSVARYSPVPVTVSASRVPRLNEDVEVAVYFCCLEALQNIVKHAGQDPVASFTIWRDDVQLCFVVQDSGTGFELEQASPGNGLINMRDRIEAIGGTLNLSSRRGQGTSVRGTVPIP